MNRRGAEGAERRGKKREEKERKSNIRGVDSEFGITISLTDIETLEQAKAQLASQGKS